MSVLYQRLRAVLGEAVNQHLKLASSDNWYVAKSDIQGQGVFAGKDYAAGDVIDVAMHAYGEDEFGSKIWNLTTLARYCNHQNRNNVEVRKAGDVFTLVASRPIKQDDELVSDYRQVTRAVGPHSRMLWAGEDIPTTYLEDYAEKSSADKVTFYHSCCGNVCGECPGCPGNMQLITKNEIDS